MANHSSAWLASAPSWFFDFPPSADPQALAPYTTEPTLATPFSIDPKLYRAALSPRVPITFAACYMTFVLWMNRRNRRRQYKPYALSKTSVFYYLTILHNVTLAVYSGVTCYAMGTGMYRSVRSPFGPAGVAGTADSLCKLSGPAAYGSAVTFDPSTASWGSRDTLVALARNGLVPRHDDAGRIWNEGLAFWGWIFYLSKFYEVIDTLIILAKGKRSATLQTYHHAGAMLCMWAGIRYMSPPIWMFVVVNSGIHTLMYTYYTINGLGFKVPQQLKRTLTTMQITQFLVGASYASFHLFVNYTIPVTVLAKAAATVPKAASAVESFAASATAGASLFDGWMQNLKEMAAMVAGSPAIGRKIHEAQPEQGQGDAAAAAAAAAVQRSTRYEAVTCLDTSGQAFAIWLNVLYLMPLTVLFVRFFVKSYIFGDSSRTGRKAERSEMHRRVSESIDAAARETSDVVEGLGRQWESSMDSPARGGAAVSTAVEDELDRTIEEIKRQGNGTATRRK